MKRWKRKGMRRKAAAIKARKVIVEPEISPEDAYKRGERHFRRHEFKMASAYFHHAARSGNSKAWAKLAVMYHRGLGGRIVDYDSARMCIKAARIAARIEAQEAAQKIT